MQVVDKGNAGCRNRSLPRRRHVDVPQSEEYLCNALVHIRALAGCAVQKR
jgi:hypothetical protein